MTKLVKPLKLSEQILSILEERIAAGIYPVGIRIPPERTLAEEFGVSRPSVRGALKMLVARNMLEARQGDGYYVSVKQQQDFLDGWQELLGKHPDWETDVYDFSRHIEGTMAALAAERRTDADLKRMTFWLEKFETSCSQNHREHQAEADMGFHQAIADAVHNILFSHLSTGLLNMLYRQTRSRFIYAEHTHDPRPTLMAHHRALFAAIEGRETARAAEIAQQHLNYVSASMREDREYQSRSLHADSLAERDFKRIEGWGE